MKKWLLIGVISIVVGGIFGFVVWKYLPTETKNEILSPMGFLPLSEKRFEVVGFLPTWMIGKTKMYGSEITQLIFSGIEVNKDGGLVWDIQSNKIENAEYKAIKDNVKKTGGKNLVSIKLFIDKDLDILVASESARARLYFEVRELVKTNGYDGVNVDFEYMSDAVRILNEDMMEMYKEMREAGWGEINIDVFANTIIKGDEERLKKLAEVVDGIIVMAYDFARPGSDFAGAVAPIGAEEGKASIEKIINRINVGNLDKEKIILAYPLYGYQWETTSGEKNSATMVNGYGTTVLYKDGIGYTGGNFDEEAKSPWFAWTEKEQRYRLVRKKVGKYYQNVRQYYTIDQWHQAYIENEESLKVKIETTKMEKLGGIGFWALGYEGKESNLIESLNH